MSHAIRATAYLLVILAFSARACAAGSTDDIPRTGGPYVPTPQEVVEQMLQLAEVGPRDFVIDLGSGDGRMVITAARRYGARGLGVDLDAELVAQSTAEAQRLGIADKVRFRVEDVTYTPLKEATVVTLYLLPGLTRVLEPRLLRELAPGSRIVAHDFALGEWKPDRELVVDVKEKYGSSGTWKSTLYLWTVPAQVAGRWQLETAGAGSQRMVVRLEQRYQELSGTMLLGGRSHAVSGGRLHGHRVQFTVAGDRSAPDAVYEGVVEADRMHGTIQRGGERTSWSATRLETRASH